MRQAENLQDESAMKLAAIQEKDATRTRSGTKKARAGKKISSSTTRSKESSKGRRWKRRHRRIGGGNIVEGRRSTADTLDKASGLHQNRIVVARWQQSRKQQQQLATRPEARERVVGSMVTSAAVVIRIAIRCLSGKRRQWIG